MDKKEDECCKVTYFYHHKKVYCRKNINDDENYRTYVHLVESNPSVTIDH